MNNVVCNDGDVYLAKSLKLVEPWSGRSILIHLDSLCDLLRLRSVKLLKLRRLVIIVTNRAAIEYFVYNDNARDSLAIQLKCL